jgi:pyruvate formate lyase activating enzyme
MKEAQLYEKLDEETVKCATCAHRCKIREGKRGICGVRENQQGTLYSLVYGYPISQAVDPIEKKPLFHFYPGTAAFSVATVGCNFHCTFCQNADISQMPRDRERIVGRETSPQQLVETARQHRCRSIAYTYTEPTVFFDYTYDTAVLARREGIANVYVTNGYMTPEVLQAFLDGGGEQGTLLDAANVDLKAFSDDFYRHQCGARLQPVLDSLGLMKEQGIWVEVTTLVIPGLNDSPEELKQIAEFIRHDLGAETPWHVSAFHPTYKLLDRPRTSPATLRMARQIGLEVGLRYVYEGNIPGSNGENTYCHNCGECIVRRYGFAIVESRVSDGKCSLCGAQIDGVGM